MILERNFFKEGKLDKANLVEFVREVKKFPGVSDEEAAVLAAAKYELSIIIIITNFDNIEPYFLPIVACASTGCSPLQCCFP